MADSRYDNRARFERRTGTPVCFFTLSLLLAAAVLLSGCVTSVNKLSDTELASLKIVGYDIRFTPDARIRWANARNDYLRRPEVAAEVKRVSKKAEERADDFEQDEAGATAKVMESPAARAYMRKRLSDLVKRHLDQGVRPHYQGTRPVKIDILINGFSIPSAVARVLIGGAPVFAAVTVLKDAKTGAELGKLDRVSAGYAGNGLLGVALDQAGSDLEDRVLGNYARNILNWLGTPSGER